MLGFLKGMFAGGKDAVIQGHWCETNIKLTNKVTTPLGSKVSVLKVCVDVRYTVEGENITVTAVDLSKSSHLGGSEINMVAERKGEAFFAREFGPNSILVDTVRADLAMPGSILRKLMLREWRDQHRTAGDGNPFAVGREIEFLYTKASGVSNRRRVTVQGTADETIRAIDQNDGKLKSFRTDRISDVKIV